MDLLKDDLEEKDVLLSKANRESRDLTSVRIFILSILLNYMT